MMTKSSKHTKKQTMKYEFMADGKMYSGLYVTTIILKRKRYSEKETRHSETGMS